MKDSKCVNKIRFEGKNQQEVLFRQKSCPKKLKCSYIQKFNHKKQITVRKLVKIKKITTE